MAWAQYRKLLLISILAFAFFSRIWQLHLPVNYIFDEVYHASTAKLIAKNDPRAFEWDAKAIEENTAIDWLHPPLAKYTQAFFINVFGSPVGGSSFAWRLSSALFGVGLIYLVYLLTQELFSDFKISLLAAFLASLDGLLLVMSRIAMNDIHVSFFILLTLIFYLKYKKLSYSAKASQDKKNKKLFWVGYSAGLAMASKWSGIFVLGPIWLFSAIGRPASGWEIKIFYKYLILLFILPFSIYVLSYAQMFSQGKSLFCFQNKAIDNVCYYGQIKYQGKVLWQGYWSHFAELHRQIIHYQTHLEATHSYQSRPLEWFLNMKPVWIWVNYGQGVRADIYAQGNMLLYLIADIFIIISLLYLIAVFAKLKITCLEQGRGKNLKLNIKDKEQKSLLFLLIAYFVVWLPWVFSPRIMFFYHYTPAVPLLCIILAFWLEKLIKINKYLVWVLLTLIILNFILFYPHWTGMFMSNFWKDNLYFFFASWK